MTGRLALALSLFGIFVQSAHGSCETEVVGDSGAMINYQTTCDTPWAQLGNALGWARLCGYGGETGKQLAEIHLRITRLIEDNKIDHQAGKDYRSAYIAMARYDSTSGCTRKKIEQIIGQAEYALGQHLRKTPLGVSIPRKDNEDSSSSTLPLGNLSFGNTTAKVEILIEDMQIITRSDGKHYDWFWEVVKNKGSVDIGYISSDRDFKPKRFEFTYSPGREITATTIDGVKVLVIEDKPFVQNVITAARQGQRFLYLSGKDNTSAQFYWWRLTRE